MIPRPSVQSSGRTAGRVAERAPRYLGSLALSDRESLFYKQFVATLHEAAAERLSNLGLDTRDLHILKTVADCRLITTQHLQRLYFTGNASPLSAARACRTTLKRLTDQKILSRRTRRIGGVRRGSSSYVYSLGSVGVKLLSTTEKQLRPYTTDSSDYFFEHTIALTELYTQLHEHHAAGRIRLLEIQTEPDCWRSFPTTSGKLCPDMFVRIARGDEEYCWFIELDRGTTHLPSILKKMHQYEQYYASGVEQAANGVFPQVLWIVPDSKRQATLQKAVASSQRAVDGLFVVEKYNSSLEVIAPPIYNESQ